MEKKVGYALHQIGEGSAISNSIKCKLVPNQKPFFVLAKRKELIFFEIIEKGINPLYKVPFTKTIVTLRVLTSKSLGKQKGSDNIIVFFHDYSFIVFSDPKNIKYIYIPPKIESLPYYICETLNNLLNPILFTINKTGQLTYWNAIDNPNTVYNINYPDQQIIDMKFLPHQTIRLAMLTDTGAGSRSVKTYTFNKKLLILEIISKYCVDQLVDSTSSIIVPFPHGDHEKPVYLVLGTETITLVFKTGVVKTDSPFKGSSPSCFCESGTRSFVVATTDGSLFGLYFDNQFNIFKIGEISILPTSITNIDGNIFYIGSSFGDSLFVQLANDSIKILRKVTQFTPVNFFSSFCENTGSIFLTQGNNNASYISELKTGIIFNKEVEIPVLNVESMFSSCGRYLIFSLCNETSICIEIGKYELVKLERFMNDCKTVNVLPRDSDSFFQVCQKTIRAVGKNTNNVAINYENDIIFSTSDGDYIFLLFDDNAEIVTKDLEPVTQFNFENSHAYTADFYQEMIAVSFYTGEIQLLSLTEVINSIKLENDELITFVHFANYKNEISLVTFSEDGNITRYNLPDLQVIDHIHLGYIIKNVFKIKSDNKANKLNNALFINSSSPVILYPNGSFSSVVCPSHSSSCSIHESLIAMIVGVNVEIGTLNNSDICSIIPKQTESRPLHFSIHKEPPSLFVSFERETNFSASAFLLPSFSQVFLKDFQLYEEITCFHYHEPIKTTFIGTALNSPKSPLKGNLIGVKELFNKFSIICNEEIEGNVYTIDSSKPDNLIVGSTSKLIIMNILQQFDGSLKLEQIQVLPTQSIPRSISILGPFIIYFGSHKAITILQEQENSIYTKFDEIIIKSTIHTGFIGKPINNHSFHGFTIENDKILTISSFKFIVTEDDNSVVIKPLSTFELDSPAAFFRPVRDGFSLISTRSGSFFALQEYSRDHIVLLKKVSSEISKFLPFQEGESKIVDTYVLKFFEFLPVELQTEIAATVKKKPNDILTFIDSLSQTLSLLCSTQKY